MNSRDCIIRWSLVFVISLIGLFFALRVNLNENALDLLPGAAVKGDLEQLTKMGLVNRLVITLTVREGGGLAKEERFRSLKENMSRLGEELAKDDQFSFVLWRLDSSVQGAAVEYVDKYLPLILEPEDYSEISSRINRKGVESSLTEAFSLLNSPAGIGLKQRIQSDPLTLSLLGLAKMEYLRHDFSIALDEGYLMSKDGRSCLLISESNRSLTDSSEASKVEKSLQQVYERALDSKVEARIIGTLPHTLANARTVQQDLKRLLPSAAIVLVLLLGITLKSVRGIGVFGVPLLAAIPAVGLTSVVYGQMSGIALGFGIVLLGIGVDFGIHLYLALVRENGTIKERIGTVRQPVLYATLTTSAVFILLHFSNVDSHRQMATLALSGIVLSVLYSWLLIPTLAPKGRLRRGEGNKSISQTTENTVQPQGARVLLVVWGGLLIAGVLTWPSLEYNGDLRLLDVPDERVRADESFFRETWGTTEDQSFILVDGTLEEALEKNSLVYRWLTQNNFHKFQSIAPLLPGAASRKENLHRWLEFWEDKKRLLKDSFMEVGGTLGFRNEAFTPFWERLDSENITLDSEQIISGQLHPIFGSMLKRQGEGQGEAGTTDREKNYLVMTTLSGEPGRIEALSRVTTAVAGATLVANSKWRAEVERLLRLDVLFLSSLAGLVIVVLVSLQFREIRAVFGVLAPVLSALSAMSVFCYITDGHLNMMHLIMGIMVIGLSVDYGIFRVCSHYNTYSGHSSNGVAGVSICAASSLVGFGVLVFANHPALHALGITVMVGIGFAWPTAIYITPLFLSKRRG